jgi:hypothetical protein
MRIFRQLGFCLLFSFLSLPAFSQGVGGLGTSVRFTSGNTNPALCNPDQVFYNLGNNTFYGCTAANTWTAFATSAGTAPGGTAGQIQFNNTGVFGAFTLSGDCTVNTGSGVLTCSPLVHNNAVNTGTSAMTLDMSASSSAAALRIPNLAGASSTTAGTISYDTTNNNIHMGANGVDNINIVLPASITPANNDCAKFTVASGVITLNTAGAACGSGTSAFNTLTSGTNTTATMTIGSGATFNIASGAVIDFSVLGTGTFKLPAAAGATASSTKNIILDSTSGLFHIFQNGADAIPLTTNAAVTIAQGGTGQVTASAAFNALSPITTAGDLIVGTGVNTAGRLGVGTNGQCLTSNGTTEVWASCATGSIGGAGAANALAKFTASATIGNSLLTDNGTTLAYSGTGGFNLSAGPLVMTQIAAPTGSAGSSWLWADSSALRLQMKNANNIAVNVVASGVDINTSDQVTVTHLVSPLSSAQGGTANGFFTVAGPATSAKTFTFPNASANVLTDNAAVTIPQGGSGTGSTLAGILRGGSSAFTGSELSGDASTSGSNVVTVLKVNGTSVPTNAAADQLLGTSASATGTWLSVPACGDSGGNHLNFTHAAGFTCGTTDLGTVYPVTVSGTVNSGGIPYFSSATVESSSAVLPSGDFVLGGGAGAAPTATFSVVPTANGGSGTGSALTGLIRGGNPFTATELSGDATTSGSNAVTVVKINGNSVPSGAAVHQVLVATASNTLTWKTITDCNGSSNALNYTQSTDLFSCLSIATLSNPMTTLGDMISGGSAGAVTRLAGPTTPSGVPQILISTPSGGLATAPVWSLAGVPGNVQSGATYTVAVTDRVSLLDTTNNTTSTAVTVPQAGSTGFGSSFSFIHCNTGTVVATDTPTTSTINGNATIKLLGQVSTHTPSCAFVYSPDNANYISASILPTDANDRLAAEAFPALTGDVTNTAGTLATTVGKVNGAVVPTSAAVLASNGSSQLIAATLTSAHLYVGNGSNVPVDVAASGDVTLANTGAFTVTKINGTAFSGTSGDVVSFGASNIPADSGVLAANLVTAASNYSNAGLVYAAAANKTTANSADWSIVSHTLTAGANALFDASAATSAAAVRVPNIAGASSTTAGVISYDTTNKMFHAGANGVDNIAVVMPSTVTPANNDCVKFTVASSVITLNTAGAACGTGGGSTFAGLTPGTNTSTTPFSVAPSTTVGGSTANFSFIGPASDTNTAAVVNIDTTSGGMASTQPSFRVGNLGVAQLQVCEQAGPQAETVIGSAVACTAINQSPFAKFVVMSATAAHSVQRLFQSSTAATGTMDEFNNATAAGTGFFFFKANTGCSATDTGCGSGTTTASLRGDGLFVGSFAAGSTAHGVLVSEGAATAAVATAADTTTTHALFATATDPAFRAIAAGDLPTTLTSGTAITNAVLTTPNLGTPSAATLTNAVGLPMNGVVSATGAIATIANGNNPLVINCALTSGTTCHTLGETSAATTAGAAELQLTTLTTSTAIPLQITMGANGPANAAAPNILSITSAAAGGLAGASNAGSTGAGFAMLTGAGSAGGSTTGNGGAGGAYTMTEGVGGVAGGTATNNGGNGGGLAWTTGAGGNGGTGAGTAGSGGSVVWTLGAPGTNSATGTAGTIGQFQITGNAPASTANASGVAAGTLFLVSGVAGGASSNATGTGGIGSIATINSGVGGAGTGTNAVGGNGGAINLASGNGGASLGTGANSNGGNVVVTLGAAGTGGSGTAGVTGQFQVTGTAIASSSTSPGLSAGTLFNIVGLTGGANTTATGTGGVGSIISINSGTGGAASGATAGTGGAGGAINITAGAGGAGSGTGANANGGSIVLTPGAAGTGGSGAAGTAGLVSVVGGMTVSGHVTLEGVTSTGATGTGNLVFATSPTFTTPVLGTPASGTLTNATGLPLNGVVSATGAITTLANGNNPFVINCALTSGTTCLTTGETTAATTSGAVEHQITTLAGSTATPLAITMGAISTVFPTAALSITQTTTGTTSVPAINIAKTLNASGLSENVINLAITNTASTGASSFFLNMSAGAAGATQEAAILLNGTYQSVGGYQGLAAGTNISVQGGLGASSAGGNVGGLSLDGSNNSSAASAAKAGYTILMGGLLTAATPNAAALQGVLQLGAGALKGSAIAAVGDVLCASTTAYTITDCSHTNPSVNIIGIASSTAAPISYIHDGQMLVKTDGAVTIGDILCMGTTTDGQAHDNGTNACPVPGAYIGTVLATSGTLTIASGSGTAATAMSTTLPLVQLHIGGGGNGPIASTTVVTGSGTSVGSTSLCSTTICPAGTYRVNVYIDITTACGTTGSYTVNLIYTDDQGSKTIPVNINGSGAVPSTGVLTTTSTANYGENAQIVRSTGAASINYSTTAAPCGTGGPMVGNLYLSVEKVQ